MESLRSFAADRTETFVGHGLIFAVTVLLVLLGRRRLAHLPADDPDLASARVIFERPYAVALLVAVVLVPTLYPRAPEALNRLAGLALLLPMLRLLPRLVEPSTRPAVYALAAFYLVHVIRDLVAATPVLERAIFAAEMLAAMGLLLLLLHPRRLLGLEPGAQLPRPLALGMRLALVLVAAALVANLLGYTVLASLLGGGVFVSAYALLILYGLVRVGRAALRLALRSQVGQRLRMVRVHAPLLQRRGRRGLEVLAILAWVGSTLEGFALLDPTWAFLREVLTASFDVGAVTVSMGDVLAFALTLAAAWLISRSLCFVLEEDVFPRFEMGRGVAYATSATVRYAVLFAGFLLAVAAAGIDVGRFTLLAGAFGVGLGFGLQAIVNNFVSGLILLYERPIQVGDTIEVGALTGEVKRIGIRSSTVRTWQGAEVIVPNASLITDSVVNWTLSDRQRRLELPVGVAYGSDPEQVIRILTDVARANPEILDDPPPLALFRGFGESSLDFELRAWTARFERGLVTSSDLIRTIYAALQEAGIQIPFPQRDLHLRSVAPAATGSAGPEASRPGEPAATEPATGPSRAARPEGHG
jgi:potassium-dependent mechanosensitive channel